VTQGLIAKGEEKLAFARLSAAMLKWHGASESQTMDENIVGSLHILPAGSTFAGMVETKVAFIEWKAPSFAFTDRAG
jgi:hypothetical protein